MEPAKQTARLFMRTKVMDMRTLEAASGQRSRRSLFRDLVSLSYFSSYSHSGRYYTLATIPEFDEHGLWRFQDVGFSRVGTLKNTVAHQVGEADAGCTHGELEALLHLRVHDTLLKLVRAKRIRRERVAGAYLYLSADPNRGAQQLALRRQRLLQDDQAPTYPARETVLLVLVEALQASEGLAPAAVVAGRLLARGEVVTTEQVALVYAQYGLQPGKKTAAPP